METKGKSKFHFPCLTIESSSHSNTWFLYGDQAQQGSCCDHIWDNLCIHRLTGLRDGSALDVSAPDFSARLFQPQDFSAPRLFSSKTFQPQDFSAPRCFSPKTFQPQIFSAPDLSAPRLFSPKTFQPQDFSAPRLFSPRCFSSCYFSRRIWNFRQINTIFNNKMPFLWPKLCHFHCKLARKAPSLGIQAMLG